MKLPTVKPLTKAEMDASNNRQRKEEIERDIRKIDEVLQKADSAEMEALHRYLDGKYQSGIMDWGHSMYGYIDGHGFSYEFLGADSIKDNLATMKPKLEGFIHGWNAKGKSSEETRQKIEDMTALSREQTDEILEKIDELEKISKESSSRKTKWEKVKPIIAFTLDKGADVAIAILSLIMQMKLGG